METESDEAPQDISKDDIKSSLEDNVDEGEIASHIKDEIAPKIQTDFLSDETSSELSLFRKSAGKRVFDKHAIDVGVASHIIKGLQEFNEACEEAQRIPSVTNLKDLIDDEENKDTIGDVTTKKGIKSLGETLQQT